MHILILHLFKIIPDSFHLCALHLMYVICTGLYKCVISELLFMAEWWASTDLIVYIDKEDLEQYYGKEHGFLIMNHRYEVDWLMGWVLCDRVNILGVSCCHCLIVFCVIVYLLRVFYSFYRTPPLHSKRTRLRNG